MMNYTVIETKNLSQVWNFKEKATNIDHYASVLISMSFHIGCLPERFFSYIDLKDLSMLTCNNPYAIDSYG